MVLDHYAAAAARWDAGAMRVYGPLAAALLDAGGCPLAGRRVLDAGAGTGAVSAELVRRGAHPVACDLSVRMLAWRVQMRPPGVVSDVRALPFVDAAFDASAAAFVLNHLTDPDAGLGELVRVTRPGGGVLASVFGANRRSRARDRVDDVARAAGWEPPDWYVEAHRAAVPLLGSATAMAAAARRAGMTRVEVDERPVDVCVTEPDHLVDYRLGHVAFATWLNAIGPDAAARVRRSAIAALGPVMQPYRPVVVFLSGRVPKKESRPEVADAAAVGRRHPEEDELKPGSEHGCEPWTCSPPVSR
jgi:ubiquinone/menaquinone biosynthesis C-methylase UbiE